MKPTWILTIYVILYIYKNAHNVRATTIELRPPGV